MLVEDKLNFGREGRGGEETRDRREWFWKQATCSMYTEKSKGQTG